MEKLLQQLVDGQKQLFEGQERLFNGQKQLEEGHKLLLEGHKQLLEGHKQLFEGQERLAARLDKLEDKVAGMAITLKENVDMTKGLKNWTEEINAQVHGLGHTLAKLEGKVNQLEEKVNEHLDRTSDSINFLLHRSAEHGEDIRRLRRAL